MPLNVLWRLTRCIAVTFDLFLTVLSNIIYMLIELIYFLLLVVIEHIRKILYRLLGTHWVMRQSHCRWRLLRILKGAYVIRLFNSWLWGRLRLLLPIMRHFLGTVFMFLWRLLCRWLDRLLKINQRNISLGQRQLVLLLLLNFVKQGLLRWLRLLIVGLDLIVLRKTAIDTGHCVRLNVRFVQIRIAFALVLRFWTEDVRGAADYSRLEYLGLRLLHRVLFHLFVFYFFFAGGLELLFWLGMLVNCWIVRGHFGRLLQLACAALVACRLRNVHRIYDIRANRHRFLPFEWAYVRAFELQSLSPQSSRYPLLGFLLSRVEDGMLRGIGHGCDRYCNRISFRILLVERSWKIRSRSVRFATGNDWGRLVWIRFVESRLLIGRSRYIGLADALFVRLHCIFELVRVVRLQRRELILETALLVGPGLVTEE